MNKIVKIYLIFATIFSISCNSWSANLNNNINKINSNNDINIEQFNYEQIEQLSGEQCRVIFREKFKKFYDKVKRCYKLFSDTYNEFYNLNYKYNKELITKFLKKYS